MANIVTAAEAVSLIQSNERVFIHGASALPKRLVEALTARASELQHVELVHLHTDGPAPYADSIYQNNFRVNALFVGANIRAAVQEGRADYTPVFLSEIPSLFRQNILPLDTALIHVSPPDEHGFCSLGVSVDITRAAIQCAKKIIAQINPNMPRTHGDGFVHISRFAAAIEVNDPLPEVESKALSPEELAIGKHCSALVEDGATLQMGIGSIPDAVLASLGDHKRLGVHTEMFSDGLIDLIQRGVVTGEEKKVHPGKIVAGFAMGSKKLYSFVHDNPMVAMLDIAYVNDAAVIRRNPKVTAINSAIEIDLTGQVCADSIGSKMFSGVGGQMDFIRGASLSPGGKPIIALPSTTSKGETRIVSFLKPGAGVVTTRAHVHYVVTEFGVAYLHGKSLRERAAALIAIAHPNHREQLEREAKNRHLGL